MTPPGDAERGATLLEALIAAALTALLAAAAASALRFGADAVDRAAETATAMEDAALTSRRLREVLQGLAAPMAGDAASLAWRGVAQAEGASRHGVWRLAVEDGVLRLSACGGPEPSRPEPCAPAAAYGPAPAAPFRYAGGDGAPRREWTDLDAPPALIVVDGPTPVTAAPRLAAGGRP